MRMDRKGNVTRQCGHFDGEHTFGDHFARASAHDPHSEHAFGLRINKNLGHSFGTVERDGAA